MRCDAMHGESVADTQPQLGSQEREPTHSGTRRLRATTRIVCAGRGLPVRLGSAGGSTQQPAAGSRLRAALLTLADSQCDTASVASLAADEGMRAYKEGDTAAAIGPWRRAIAAESTDPKVADRLSVVSPAAAPTEERHGGWGRMSVPGPW